MFLCQVFICFICFTYNGFCDQKTEDLIDIFTRRRWFTNRQKIQKLIGPFIEPTEFVEHSYAQLKDLLYSFSRKYPDITYFYSIGKSVNGRDLPVIAIASEARYDDSDIPDFKFIANVHGNEVIGLELLLILVQVLLQNYGKNKYLTRLVNTTSIHIMPTMNPDGYEQYRSDRTTPNSGFTNANMIDLGIDFPHQQLKMTKHPQPETQAVMNWTRTIPFLLSANLRDGAYFVGYPLDNSSTTANSLSQTRDHRLLVRLAYEYMHLQSPYSDKVKTECPMQNGSNSRVINGAEYSPEIGTMQDWNYLNSDCIELTIFLHCQQITPSNTLKYLWNMHKYSLINYIAQVHQSLDGYIRDRHTNSGIVGVKVDVKGSGKPVYSQNNGAFFRLLNPGTYTVVLTHPSYRTVKRDFTVGTELPHEKVIILMTSSDRNDSIVHNVNDGKYLMDATNPTFAQQLHEVTKASQPNRKTMLVASSGASESVYCTIWITIGSAISCNFIQKKFPVQH